MTRLHVLFVAAALAATPAAGEKKSRSRTNIKHRLPYAGTVKSFDAKTAKVEITGSDGKSMKVRIRSKFLMRAGAEPVERDQLGEHIGEPVAMLLRDKETADFIGLIELGEEPVNGFLTQLFESQQQIAMRTLDGFTVRFKPSVNLGATDKVDGKPEPGSWAWFEKRIGKPLAFRKFEFLGSTFVWSVKGWKPPKKDKDKDKDEKAHQPSEKAKERMKMIERMKQQEAEAEAGDKDNG